VFSNHDNLLHPNVFIGKLKDVVGRITDVVVKKVKQNEAYFHGWASDFQNVAKLIYVSPVKDNESCDV